MPKVLITGAYGLVGNAAYRWLTATAAARYDVYGMVRRRAPSARLPAAALTPIPDDRLRVADLTDREAVQGAVAGMDVVVHLAANPDPTGSWESILANNIVGTYHVFEACRRAGVGRVIFASTIQVIFGYRSEEPYRSLLEGRFEAVALAGLRPIRHDQPPRPLNDYAASKVWGESLAHLYAYSHGLSCLALRIGWVLAEDRVPQRWGESVFCSQRDIAQLIERCIAAPADLRFGIFFGLSDNRYNLADIAPARELLGYVPQDGYR
ncbi:MAG: NAD(P)-dependent oxidoreductase [Anaerolineae bacterium]|nr:NAD(P)-dependent oxidoreductase [Anaerolineae bacterium]